MASPLLRTFPKVFEAVDQLVKLIKGLLHAVQCRVEGILILDVLKVSKQSKIGPIRTVFHRNALPLIHGPTPVNKKDERLGRVIGKMKKMEIGLVLEVCPFRRLLTIG